ncbi:MAG: peptide chain release factor N(5)-glutamine methyltransferase [Candidatus Dadabacteria bacterium]|nr:peptide chain release factor N(5)-glutamine methyltransferase [Candidatus Dadabacteria bacterium]NIQ16306.1 peptide chain release factor N(5)-glutamine methyltransferase [Candidatus Dadabacteria bacterium]
MNLQELYNLGKEKFKNANFQFPDIESRTILQQVLNKDLTYIYTNPQKLINKAQIDKFNDLADRRLNGEPYAYIKGKKEFYSREFTVNPDVLIPRPETELLVEEALKLIKKYKNPTVLDLGTGSGCIAVTLASEFYKMNMYASDTSFKALLTAITNSKLNNCSDKINFINSNLLTCFDSCSFDIIISNPPYISEEDFKNIQNEVKDHEPKSALLSGKKGLDHLTEIVNKSFSILKNNGWCILEVGYNQSAKVEKMFLDNGFINIQTIEDLNNIGRVVRAQCKK